MDKIETVGIRAFSGSVSSYVRKAALGVRVLLSDRGRVVAELSKPGGPLQRNSDLHPLANEWVEKGWFRRGDGTKVGMHCGEELADAGTALAVLAELRQE